MPARWVIREPRQFGNVIREARRSQGMTQEHLADWTGVHRTYLSAVERGKAQPGLRLMLSLLNALGVDLVAERRGPDDA